jgi:hypothetical protein
VWIPQSESESDSPTTREREPYCSNFGNPKVSTLDPPPSRTEDGRGILAVLQSLFLCGEEGFRKKSSAVVSNGTCGLSNLNTPHNLDVLWIDPNHRLKEERHARKVVQIS